MSTSGSPAPATPATPATLAPASAAPMNWPPLVGIKSLSRSILIRDFLLTLGAWMVFAGMLHNALYLAWDYLSYPMFEYTNAQPPDWLELWSRIQYEMQIVALLMTWLLAWGYVRRASLSRVEPQPPPPALSPGEHARALGLAPEQVRSWQTERSLVAHFDAEGHIISMIPSKADQRQ